MKINFIVLVFIVSGVFTHAQNYKEYCELLCIYNQEGKISKEGNLKNGKRQGYWKFYDCCIKGAPLIEEGNYENDKKTGIWKTYSRINYEIGSVENHDTGVVKIYHLNGKLKAEGHYDKNHWYSNVGEWKEYYENGHLKAVGNYTDGKKAGIWKEYDEQGKLNAFGEIKNYRRYGEWETYHSNGKIFAKGKYNDDGYPQKETWVTYNENGDKDGCNCPEPTDQDIASICNDQYSRYESKLDDFTYTYQEKLWQISCAEPGVDNLESARVKIQCMWNKYREKFRCYNYSSSSATDANILKLSIDDGLSGLSVEWFRKYKLDFNFIDPQDGKTILDWLNDQEIKIRKTPPVNTERADEYQRLYKMFKTGGAKHSSELNN